MARTVNLQVLPGVYLQRYLLTHDKTVKIIFTIIMYTIKVFAFLVNSLKFPALRHDQNQPHLKLNPENIVS